MQNNLATTCFNRFKDNQNSFLVCLEESNKILNPLTKRIDLTILFSQLKFDQCQSLSSEPQYCYLEVNQFLKTEFNKIVDEISR